MADNANLMRVCARSISKWVGTIERYSQIYFNRNLRKYGITSGQVPFLMYLYEDPSNPGIPQDQFSKELCFDKGTVARALQSLEDIGFVRRVTSETNRRKNIVFLTDKAIEVGIEIAQAMAKWTDLLTRNMSPEEASILMVMLRKTFINSLDIIEEIGEDESDPAQSEKSATPAR